MQLFNTSFHLGKTKVFFIVIFIKILFIHVKWVYYYFNFTINREVNILTILLLIQKRYNSHREKLWDSRQLCCCCWFISFYSASFFRRWNSHGIKLTILNHRIYWNLYIHNTVQLSPLTSSRLFSSPQKETRYPWRSHSTLSSP